ncbi:hypothetical protein C8F04DRAFT_1120686 [Mycena alexandri]|uniref:Uncharacterized protein n=1 Tax=Mycena alexandri TaxID=1745969 RepID=A0AAD6WX76_9AGAR|nr:hypothetical protein C8F04DRAFT_1120686 [Mycena alexandri]
MRTPHQVLMSNTTPIPHLNLDATAPGHIPACDGTPATCAQGGLYGMRVQINILWYITPRLAPPPTNPEDAGLAVHGGVVRDPNESFECTHGILPYITRGRRCRRRTPKTPGCSCTERLCGTTVKASPLENNDDEDADGGLAVDRAVKSDVKEGLSGNQKNMCTCRCTSPAARIDNPDLLEVSTLSGRARTGSARGRCMRQRNRCGER